MSSARLMMLLALLCAAGGCASSYQVVQLPQREADLYPLSQTRAGVTVAIDEIRSPGRAARYFGANLIGEGVLPLAVIVSNYSGRPVSVKPSDILLHRGKEIVDPLPLEMVTAIAKEQHAFLRSRTEKQVERYFEQVAFKETVVSPGDTYQGVMFFPVPRQQRDSDRFFTMLSLFRDGGPKVRIGVTDPDTRTRRHYGPFSLSIPDLFRE